MFENIIGFFKRLGKNKQESSSSAAKERLHLVLAQDRANISADFLEMMKQEIIEVIKKYIDIDEEAIDVKMTNKAGEDGTLGAPALFANIPIITIKNEARKLEGTLKAEKQDEKEKASKEQSAENNKEIENQEESKQEEVVEEKQEIESKETEVVETVKEQEKQEDKTEPNETEAQKEEDSFIEKEQEENEKEAKDEEKNS